MKEKVLLIIYHSSFIVQTAFLPTLPVAPFVLGGGQEMRFRAREVIKTAEPGYVSKLYLFEGDNSGFSLVR
jgi:hypothetical protein